LKQVDLPLPAYHFIDNAFKQLKVFLKRAFQINQS